MLKTEVSTSIKVISIFYLLSALFSMLGGILLIIMISMMESLSELGANSHYVGFAVITCFVLSMFQFFVGQGLWKGKMWAKIVAMFIAGLGIGFAIALIIIELNILISTLILLFNAAILSFFFYDFYG